MEILLITVGKTKTKYIVSGIEEYSKRLKHYIPFFRIEIPDVKGSKGMNENIQKEKEGLLILEKISSSDFVILLDERGEEKSSIEFSEYIQKLMLSGRKRVVFIIGGPYGFSNEIYARANSKLSLSRMTFNHEMVRMFFIEQIYRSMTILRGEPYHHE